MSARFILVSFLIFWKSDWVMYKSWWTEYRDVTQSYFPSPCLPHILLSPKSKGPHKVRMNEPQHFLRFHKTWGSRNLGKKKHPSSFRATVPKASQAYAIVEEFKHSQRGNNKKFTRNCQKAMVGENLSFFSFFFFPWKWGKRWAKRSDNLLFKIGHSPLLDSRLYKAEKREGWDDASASVVHSPKQGYIGTRWINVHFLN